MIKGSKKHQSFFKFGWSGLFILFVFSLTQFNFSVYSQIIPSVRLLFNISIHQAGLTLTYCFIGYMVGQLFWGTISDFFNRKVLIICSLILFIAFNIIEIFTINYIVFLIFYILMGFMVACYTSVGNALVKDIYKKKEYYNFMAWIGIAMAAGPAIGPVLGSIAYNIFSGKVFGAFIVIGLLGIIVLLGFYPLVYLKYKKKYNKIEKKYVQENNTKNSTTYLGIITNINFIVYTISLGATFGTLISYLSIGPFIFINNFGIDKSIYGYIFFVSTIFYLFGAIFYKFLIRSSSPQAIFLFCSVISTIASFIWLILIISSNNVHCVVSIILLSCYFFGIGGCVPAGKSSSMTVFNTKFGFTASMMKFIQSGFGVLVSGISNIFDLKSSLIPIAGIYLICSGAPLLLMLIVKIKRNYTISI